jgi:homoserine kinase type II
MSVYTTIDSRQLSQLLRHYPVGELIAHQGIVEGMENTNYFVHTPGGEYVLTLFEGHDAESALQYLQLTCCLSLRGVACAHPVERHDGELLSHLMGKPAALFNRLAGSWPRNPSLGQCCKVGRMLAGLHVQGGHCGFERENERDLEWMLHIRSRLEPYLSRDELRQLQQELGYQSANRNAELPWGVIHADLFRDNVLFDGDGLSGFIDFYSACRDNLLYDLAVTANDWCLKVNGDLDRERCMALLCGYASVRELADSERLAWPRMLRLAALRFWLSRLVEKCFPRQGELALVKDPDHFRLMLQKRIALAQSGDWFWPETRECCSLVD